MTSTALLKSILLLSAAAVGADDTTIVVQGREVSIHIPTCISQALPRTVATVISFHGWGGDGAVQQRTDDFDALSEKRCFVSAHPTGLNNAALWFSAGYAWAAGGCCPDNDGQLGFSDDVGFTRELFRTLFTTYDALDPDALFVAGISNGGMMANRVSCELEEVAAFASVAGPLVNGSAKIGETFECDRVVPTLHVSGLLDSVVPSAGCSSTEGPLTCRSLFQLLDIAAFPSADDHVAAWRARNGVLGVDGIRTFEKNNATCRSWATSALDNVTLCTIADGGHSWPGHADCDDGDPLAGCTYDLNTSESSSSTSSCR